MKYISFFGSIGVGKTTSGKNLILNDSSFQFIEENLNHNIFLEKFYGDMKKWAFPSTIEMLTLMLEYYNYIDKNKEFIVFDNGIHELICYNQLLLDQEYLTKDEFDLYQRLYNNILKNTPPIDLYVFFYCDEKIALERIHKRGRSYEKKITISFLKKLNDKYWNYVKNLPKEKVLYICTDQKLENVDLASRIIHKLNI